ncbi:activating transcription factor 3 [Mytilus galloprovincialis]|uniref:Activating transcription factor 3 n=1 Tax=Mytilus galloprovincialis TaxID=29158 RepID=A0A8B6C5S1_MYTGA|nr:activating transcription factor 3 [Mytilus galloprovincialis]
MDSSSLNSTSDDESVNQDNCKSTRKPMLPFIKAELRCKIQRKRLSQGLQQLRADFTEKRPSILTKEEHEKQIVRKERNKLAARKCRQRKRQITSLLQEEIRELTDENKQLKERIRCLELNREQFVWSVLNNQVTMKMFGEIYRAMMKVT